MARRDELKGRRERRYSLGDLPDRARYERGELPRAGAPPLPPSGPIQPGAGLAAPQADNQGPVGGPKVPPAGVGVTSVYDARPLRGTDFVVFSQTAPLLVPPDTALWVYAGFIVPQGKVAVIRNFSYWGGTQEIPDVAVFDSMSFLVNGVAVEGIPQPDLNGQTPWPSLLLEQSCFVIAAELSEVKLGFFVSNLGDVTTVDEDGVFIKFYGNFLPTHGLPPSFEIGTMTGIGAAVGIA